MNTDILNLLFDGGSFVQTNSYVLPPVGKHDGIYPGDGVITGYGSVSGRAVFAAIQDESVSGGSVGAVHARKISECIDMAVKVGAPFVFVIDSAGARLDEGPAALSGYGAVMKSMSAAVGAVPTFAFINGNCYGAASIIASMADFTVMPEDKAAFSFAGTDFTGNGAGSAGKAALAGTLACKGRDTSECTEIIRKLIDLLPDNSQSSAPDVEEAGDMSALISTEGLGTFEDYDVRKLIARLSDSGEYTELYAGFAESALCSLTRIGGKTVCIIANQPSVRGGVIDADACSKMSGIIAFCDRFNIPVVTLTNTCGIASSEQDEAKGIPAACALLANSFSCSSVPKINIITGRAYGSAYLVMNGKSTGADIVYAWKSADIAAITPEAGALIVYDEEIRAAEDHISARKAAVEKYRQNYSTPLKAAYEGLVDDIIAPEETRARIISALYLLN